MTSMAQAGGRGLSRDSLFVMSMVPKYLMGFNETKASVAASLAQLQLECVACRLCQPEIVSSGE